MKSVQIHHLLLVVSLMVSTVAISQSSKAKGPVVEPDVLKTYLIEREIPNAGDFTAEQWQGISQKSNKILKSLGPDIKWVHSYVTDNKVYCIYKATNKEIIEKHAQLAGIPVSAILQISTKINPDTGKQ